MANQVQLELLKQGVEVWNEWREMHPYEEIDLDGANLQNADLRGANLQSVYLRSVNLQNADLEDVNLQGADLERADLRRVNLQNADLQSANLVGADLRRADLQNADLQSADLEGADLEKADLQNADLQDGTNLRNAKLQDANLQGANLCDSTVENSNLKRADLQNANLQSTNLQNSNLQGANLQDAILWNANLQFANLEAANLQEAILWNADLRFANITQANLTGAWLFAAAKDQWKIDAVRCDYVFWDKMPDIETNEERMQWKAIHRVPQYRNFLPGEFEELYKQLPTFEYAFEHGFTPLDAVVMDRIVAAINEQHPEFELELDSFQSRGQPHATFTVLHKEHLETAKQQVATTYERRILELEAQKTQLMEVVKMLGSGGFAFQPMHGGMNIRPMLPSALTQEIVAFLITLPNIHDRNAQQAFLLSAGLDAALFNQLHIGEPPTSFINALISNCMAYGQLNDGRHSLIAVMNAAKQLVGTNRQADADALIQQIEAQVK